MANKTNRAKSRKAHPKTHRKVRRARKGTRKKQGGGGFSFTGVLASVILSVGSVMGLKQSGVL